ncbi:MAG TPA: YggS family pyridoxal phosphate enzyme, partial [Anaerolineales bacterium]|nr:YggS family pyridoxal phosphate enzyme [Anaerolineales bacterium]
HMIGHVQSRKAAAVVEAGFDLIHSVDTLRLAERLSRAAQPTGRTQPVLLECNVSGEDSKSGFVAANHADWSALIDTWSTLGRLPGLSVVGLMTMAPWGTDDETARPIFARLRELSALAQARLGLVWPVLSMGMTDDYAGAVREGATHVRVGRAIFGDRG